MWKLIEVFVFSPILGTPKEKEIHDRQREALQEYLLADYIPFQVTHVPDGKYYYLRKYMLNPEVD